MSSPLSELSYYESELEEHLTEEYAQERELTSPALTTSNAVALVVTRNKQKTPSFVIMSLGTSRVC